MVQTDWGSGSGSDDPGLCGAEWPDCSYGDVDCLGVGSAVLFGLRLRDVDRHAQSTNAKRAVSVGLRQRRDL